MSSLAIARRLGVTDKTVAKAVSWYGCLHCFLDG
jgi:hypothetical protein